MISVVVPVYNAAGQLERCLDSIAAQSFRDWECILVDDGSADLSGRICDDKCLGDGRFRCFHQSNRGVSAARNKGIAESRGDYLCFVDADDWLEEDYLEELSAGIAGADLVVSGQIREYPSGKTAVHRPDGTFGFMLAPENADAFLALEKKMLLYAAHGKLYRRDVIAGNGLAFPEEYSYGEDLLFNFDYYSRIRSVRQTEYSGYHYRIGDGNSLSTKFRPRRFEDDCLQWRRVESFYDSEGLRTGESEKYHAAKLWGIVYDGLFLFPELEDASLGYLRKILSIPETGLLAENADSFRCQEWIKRWILKGKALRFYLYFRLLYPLRRKRG